MSGNTHPPTILTPPTVSTYVLHIYHSLVLHRNANFSGMQSALLKTGPTAKSVSYFNPIHCAITQLRHRGHF